MSEIIYDPVTCAESGEEVPRADCFVRHDGECVSNCFRYRYFISDHNGDYFHIDERVYVAGFGEISQTELDNGFPASACEDCGDYVYDRSRHSLDENGRCLDCARVHSTKYTIKDYACKRFAPPIGKGPLYLGVELEVEVVNVSSDSEDPRADLEDHAVSTQTRFSADFVILKEDGSLDTGFEIVTRPASFDVQLTEWTRFFDAIPRSEYLRDLRSWNPGNCGMHVHVSRTALSGLQLGKMLVFVNSPEHTEFIKFVAGRDAARWAARHVKRVGDARMPDFNRYQAINTSGSNTIEFRIFRGTLRRERFFANLEFVQSLCEFTAPAGRSIADGTSVHCYLRWLDRRRKRFPNLHTRLVEKEYLPKPKTDQRPQLATAASNT